MLPSGWIVKLLKSRGTSCAMLDKSVVGAAQADKRLKIWMAWEIRMNLEAYEQNRTRVRSKVLNVCQFMSWNWSTFYRQEYHRHNMHTTKQTCYSTHSCICVPSNKMAGRYWLDCVYPTNLGGYLKRFWTGPCVMTFYIVRECCAFKLTGCARWFLTHNHLGSHP